MTDVAREGEHIDIDIRETSPRQAAIEHFEGRLDALEARIRAAIDLRRLEDPEIDDPFRGLYITPEQAVRLLGRERLDAIEASIDEPLRVVEARADGTGHDDQLPLRRLATTPGLDDLEIEALLIALAPDVDVRFEKFYGLLNDDVSRRQASIGLVLELCRRSPLDRHARAAFMPGSRLVDHGLLIVEEPERPFLSRPLRVSERVTASLLGSRAVDPLLAPLVDDPAINDIDTSPQLADLLTTNYGLLYIREELGTSGAATTAASAASVGRRSVVIDIRRLRSSDEPNDWRRLALAITAEAVLGAVVIVGPVDALDERHPLVAEIANGPADIVLFGRRDWDTSWSRRHPLVLDAAERTSSELHQLWADAISRHGGSPTLAQDMNGFRLTSPQVADAAQVAKNLADYDDDDLSLDHLYAGVRQQNASALGHLAKRITPEVGWDDLVLEPDGIAALEGLADRVRHRDLVIGDWGMRPGGARGRGVTGLFAGPSGTGKTMSAEVLAGDLGLDLYVINLATVVDKYVGETEKNLERIFAAADGVNGVLLFDEADSLFGKRSDVSDAHDRYANIEVAYLLQRMETFDGVAVLSTNLRANLDDAFIRRLDAIIDFVGPGPDARLELWRKSVGPLSLDDSVDLEFCAERFELTGGSIRAAAIAAAYRAAAGIGVVVMADIVVAIASEFRKQGLLCREQEFGEYHGLVSRSGSSSSSSGRGRR